MISTSCDPCFVTRGRAATGGRTVEKRALKAQGRSGMSTEFAESVPTRPGQAPDTEFTETEAGHRAECSVAQALERGPSAPDGPDQVGTRNNARRLGQTAFPTRPGSFHHRVSRRGPSLRRSE